MPKPTKGPRLGSGPAHQKLMLAGLASQLIMHERIRTTEAKAKRLRPVADRLVSLGKQGSVHARRRALSLVEDREVIHKLFSEVAPRFAERNGGYTRVLKLGPRQGDAAPMAIIEFVEGSVAAPHQIEAEGKRRRGLRRRQPAKSAAERRRSEAEEPSSQEGEEEPGILQGAEPAPAAGETETGAAEAAGREAVTRDSAAESEEADLSSESASAAEQAQQPPPEEKS